MLRTSIVLAAFAILALPAQPASATSAPFLVFFDHASAGIDARGASVIANARKAFSSYGLFRLTVSGYADRSGSDEYNRQLSMRRALAVKDALVRLGYPAEALDVEAFGETRPLLDTEDGVRERRNRHVSIVVSAPFRKE